MLDFDPVQSAFHYDGVVIGPGTIVRDLPADLAGTLADMPGQPGWSVLKTRGRPINLSLSFHHDVAHSGFFWADVAGGGWDEAEATEAARRAAHQQIAGQLFGSDRYEDDRVKVYLVRDPRSFLEEIFFEFYQGGALPKVG